MIDVLFISPSNSQVVYQELAINYSAVEPPTWALLLAQAARSKGYEVGILDTCAENLSNEESLSRINQFNPKFICFVVYGQNVNSGVVSMSGAVRLSEYLKTKTQKTVDLLDLVFVGDHVRIVINFMQH